MSFDQMMIRYTAPTLCEIKSGNLFAVKKSEFSVLMTGVTVSGCATGQTELNPAAAVK